MTLCNTLIHSKLRFATYCNGERPTCSIQSSQEADALSYSYFQSDPGWAVEKWGPLFYFNSRYSEEFGFLSCQQPTAITGFATPDELTKPMGERRHSVLRAAVTPAWRRALKAPICPVTWNHTTLEISKLQLQPSHPHPGEPPCQEIHTSLELAPADKTSSRTARRHQHKILPQGIQLQDSYYLKGLRCYPLHSATGVCLRKTSNRRSATTFNNPL